MGEIRSTLDIIMEKTEGLTMTAEERKAIQRNEIGGKIRGLFQRYLDGALDLEKVLSEIMAMEGEGKGMALESLRGGVQTPRSRWRRISLPQDPGDGFEGEYGPVRRVLSAYHEEMDQRKRSSEARALERLRSMDISGSALVPNLRADPASAGCGLREGMAFLQETSFVSQISHVHRGHQRAHWGFWPGGEDQLLFRTLYGVAGPFPCGNPAGNR